MLNTDRLIGLIASTAIGIVLVMAIQSSAIAHNPIATEQFSDSIPPHKFLPLTSGNAKYLKQVAMLGRGPITSLAWMPNGEALAAGTNAGVWLYNVRKPDSATPFFASLRGVVKRIVFNRDGNLMAAVADTVQVWDVTTGQQVHTLDKLTMAVGFKPDGTLLAAGFESGDEQRENQSLHIWDVASGKQISEFALPIPLRVATFSHDGTLLAIGGGGLGGSGHPPPPKWFNISVWDVQTGLRSAPDESYGGGLVTSLDFSGDDRVMVAGIEGTTKLWNIATGVLMRAQTGHLLAYDATSDILAINTAYNRQDGAGSQIQLWTGTTGEPLKSPAFSEATLPSSRLSISLIAFSPTDGKLAATDGVSLQIGKMLSDEPPTVLAVHAPAPDQVMFSPDGSTLVSIARTRYFPKDYDWVQIYDVFNGFKAGPSLFASAVRFSPDGSLLAYVDEITDRTHILNLRTGQDYVIMPDVPTIGLAGFSADSKVLALIMSQQIILWDIQGQKPQSAWESSFRGALTGEFTSSGNFLIIRSITGLNEFQVWDVKTGQAILTAQGLYMRFNSDETLLLYGNGEKNYEYTLWNVSTRADQARFTYEAGWSTAFSADGQYLFVPGPAKTIRVIAIKTSQDVATLAVDRDTFTMIRFSPHGTFLAINGGESSQTIRLWNPATGQLVATLNGHTRWVYDMLFSPDESLLISSSLEFNGLFGGTIRLWDTRRGIALGTLYRNGGNMRIVLSPDGTMLASVAGDSGDGVVKVWAVDSDNLR